MKNWIKKSSFLGHLKNLKSPNFRFLFVEQLKYKSNLISRFLSSDITSFTQLKRCDIENGVQDVLVCYFRLQQLVTNKHQSNLAKGGIAAHRYYSPGGSSNLQLHVLVGVQHPISPSPWGSGTSI